MRQGKVFIHGNFAGTLTEKDEGGYSFFYDDSYLRKEKSYPVSLTLPLQKDPFHSQTLFAFFDGLIPEGWILDQSVKYWKLKMHDRMGLLLKTCGNCIGAVHIEEI